MIGQPLPHPIRQRWWPNLTDENHSITSPETDEYNCVAWAYEVSNRKMWPGYQDYYWPSGVAGKDELETVLQLYLDKGYEKCESSEREVGYKKIAIYVKQDRPKHAALQLDSGHWTSKLGDYEDIEHDTLEALEGESYGQAVIFLRKPRA